MNNFECQKCFRIFKTKQQLQRHEQLKNKCDTITDFQCETCLKYFKSKHTLTEHKNCKTFNIDKINELKIKDTKKEILNQDNKIENGIKEIINSNLSIEQKIVYIKKYNIKDKLTDDELKELILLNQISYICSLIELNNNIVNNTVNNNINNGTVNNIQINNFGSENIEYLDNEYFKKLLSKNNFEHIYLTLTKDIYLRVDHPENRTVKIENLNNKFAYKYENGKWKGILKSELKDLLHIKNKKLIKVHLESLKDILDEKIPKEMNMYLKRDNSTDAFMKDLNERNILLLYRGKTKNEI
jgi:hypothetical protein